MSLQVLIIDDDPIITGVLESICTQHGHQADVLNNPLILESKLNKAYDLIFLDLQMPGMDGIEVMRVLEKHKISSNIVLISGFERSVLNTAHELADAHGLAVVSHIMKPFDRSQVEAVFRQVSELDKSKKISLSTNIKAVQINDAELKHAIKEKRVEVFYQPQLDLKNQRVIGVEALCRLRSSSGELIYPDQFIPLAEELGLIHHLTLLVAHIVAHDYAKLFMQYPGMTVSINISTQDLAFLEFPETLHKIFSDKGVESSWVIIEVTETRLLHDLQKGLDVLARMRLKGFKVSIDDFGKGSATLDHVKHFPATEIKIDKEFIQSVGEKDKSHVIVSHTLEFAHTLELDVVAEGVEDQETADWLKSKGCDIAQGYWLSKPLPLDEIESFLLEKNYEIENDSVFSICDLESTSRDEIVANTNIDSGEETSGQDGEVLISSVLPLSGSFSFIGNSQLYGIKAGLNEYHLEEPGKSQVKVEVFDDKSDINMLREIAKDRLSPKSLACLGGVFTLGNTKNFLDAALVMKRAVIGPFSGSVLLRNESWKNLFNIRPSYEDEIKCIIDDLRMSNGKTVLVYPENAFGNRAKVIVEGLMNIEHISYGADSRIHKNLLHEIVLKKSKNVIFIGASKTLVNIVRETEGMGISFYTISLVGLGSLVKSLESCDNSVYVTAPIEDYQGNTVAATQFRKHLSPLLNGSDRKYMNSISYEAYLNTKVFLKALQKIKMYNRAQLVDALESIVGADIGLSSPVTWDGETRQFLHQVHLLKNKVCSK